MKNSSYNATYARVKDLKGPFVYNGVKYPTLTDLCLAEGVDRDRVIMLYITTNWTIDEVIHIAYNIETLN